MRRVKDIGGDDVLEMLYEPYTRIDRRGISKGTAIIYNARVEDIGGDDVLEMLYEPYTRIDSGDHFKG